MNLSVQVTSLNPHWHRCIFFVISASVSIIVLTVHSTSGNVDFLIYFFIFSFICCCCCSPHRTTLSSLLLISSFLSLQGLRCLLTWQWENTGDIRTLGTRVDMKDCWRSPSGQSVPLLLQGTVTLTEITEEAGHPSRY